MSSSADVKRLRLLTIVVPIAFLLLVEIFSLVVLEPVFGRSAVPRLLTIFAILTVGVVPFSLWVFSVLERQHRQLVQSAALLDSVTDYAIFMLDPAGRIVSWSPGAEQLKGYTAPEIIGRPLSIFYLPDDVASGKPEQLLADAVEQGRVEIEGWRVRKDGSRFWAHIVSTPLRDEHGELTGFTHVAHDITERMEAMERIRALNAQLGGRVDQLAVANAEILRRNRELDALNSAITSISSALDLPAVLQKIADSARTLLGARYAALGVSDESGKVLQFITSGISEDERAAIGPLPEGHGMLGVLIKEGKPLRVPDIGKDPRSHGFPPNHPPMYSLLGVPILYKGTPVGDLYLTDKIDADEFSQADQDLLMLLANHAAVAIENARLYGEVREARDSLQVWNEELEAKVAERTREIQRYSKELTTRVLQAQEEERKRIARELHDETAQSLSTLLINLDLLEMQVPADAEPLRSGLDRVRTLARRILDETRALSHDLRPTILDDVGLVAALHWFAAEFTRTYGVPVEVQAEQPLVRLSPEHELALFRIAHEALTNVGKYAQATPAGATLTFGREGADLLIEDDGRGFDPSEVSGPSKQGGLGLYGMRERATLLGGQAAIESAPGAGTRIHITMPLEAADLPLTGVGG